MMQDLSIVTGKAVPSEIDNRAVGKDTIKVTTQSEGLNKLFGREKMATVNSVLHVPDVEHSLIFESSLCHDDYTMEFTNRKCVVKKNNFVISAG